MYVFSPLHLFDKWKLLFKKQFGFKHNHSTDHALTSQLSCLWSFFNLQKVFDTVEHEILLDKLGFYSILWLANSWLKSFLENKKQYVNLHGHSWSVKTVTCGVLQDSTLGVLVFLLYINDLQSVFLKPVFHNFADDTNVLVPAKELGTIESAINHELKLLVQWL